jgi:excisionase family DNA binding protein
VTSTEILLERAVADARTAATLRGPDGHIVQVPAQIYDLVQQMLRALREGQVVAVRMHSPELTTQQAADLLGVSRPTLVRLLDEGEIPSTRPNKHRRVQVADLVAYRERRHAERLKGLAEMVEISEELGLYDEPDGPPIRR